jgi:hypothetical protein
MRSEVNSCCACVSQFFIQIWGIKCRNLRASESTFAVLNWDDYAFEKKTKAIKGGNSPKVSETF